MPEIQKRFLLLGFSVLFLLGPAADTPGQTSEVAPSVVVQLPAGQATVELPFHRTMNKIVLPVRLNGSEPLDFVLDSGAGGAVLLNSEGVADLGLTWDGDVDVGGAGSGPDFKARRAIDVTFALGGLELRGSSIAVLPPSFPADQMPWDGIFGRQVFENLVVEIDWDEQLLRFHDPAKWSPPAGARTFDLQFRNGHSFLRAEIETGTKRLPVELVIDTGAATALSLASADPRLRPEKVLSDRMMGRGLSGSIRGDVGRIPTLFLAASRRRYLVSGR